MRGTSPKFCNAGAVSTVSASFLPSTLDNFKASTYNGHIPKEKGTS